MKSLLSCVYHPNFDRKFVFPVNVKSQKESPQSLKITKVSQKPQIALRNKTGLWADIFIISASDGTLGLNWTHSTTRRALFHRKRALGCALSALQMKTTEEERRAASSGPSANLFWRAVNPIQSDNLQMITHNYLPSSSQNTLSFSSILSLLLCHFASPCCRPLWFHFFTCYSHKLLLFLLSLHSQPLPSVGSQCGTKSVLSTLI